MKVSENLKSAIWRWRVAFPIKDMGDPPAVLRCITAGSILVLLWSSIILYIHVCINDIVAPELIKTLNHFSAWTVTLGQSKNKSYLFVIALPILFQSLSLLEEGSSS